MIGDRKNRAKELAVVLQSEYGFRELNLAFRDRSLDERFQAIGEAMNPQADANWQVWTGYELATDSEYYGRK